VTEPDQQPAPDESIVASSTDAGTDPTPTAPVVAGSVPLRPPLRQRVREAASERLPAGSRGRAVARAGLLTYREVRETASRVRSVWTIPGLHEPGPPTYRAWLRKHSATAAQLATQREWSADPRHGRQVVAVVLPGPGDVAVTLRSLAEQSHSRWTASVLGRGDSEDPRVHHAPVTGPLAAAVNAAVAGSTADLVVILQAGDVLAPDCLFEAASSVHRDPRVQVVTWDDDVVTGRGRQDPRFRPSWSPEMLLGADYVGRAFAVRRGRWEDVGGLSDVPASVRTWDLLLRIDPEIAETVRVPRVLSSVVERPAVVLADAVPVVQAHLDRRGWPARAEARGDVVHVRWNLPSWPRVSVVIPTRHNRTMLQRCLPGLATTDYPDFEVRIVDNGGQTPENEQWYRDNSAGLDLSVLWWHQQPFNYSQVNNAAVAETDGEILVFLNDDTEVLDASWLKELVGWATRPQVGITGLQLLGPAGEIQHAGAILGLNGFADHVFEGMAPGSDSLLGNTSWYRNALAVTGACMAIRRELYDRLGGMDERFILCGSDVALGLDAHLLGLRNVCSPLTGVRHLESATRGSTVPPMDFFTSYWRYSPWLFGGDPYFSPNLSLGSRTPVLRSVHEPTPQQRIAGPLGREFVTFRQRNDEAESRALADQCRALPSTVQDNQLLHELNAEPFDVRTVNWFIPDIDSPFYGGINTALRIADHLARTRGVVNRFVVWGSPADEFNRSALTAAFPSLADAEIVFHDGRPESLAELPPADVAVATLWVTAFAVAHAGNVRRKFYLIQDFEPMFYPASTLYALAEESYRLGLYGLCNTDNLRQIYADDYAGKGMSFMPAVDPTVFHARDRRERGADEPATLFVYARPGHWRNCWELASLALEEVKRRLGDGVRIVTAGAWATGGGSDADIKHLGLLDYRATGELYRASDVGLALTVSKHPSYLPLELMACGVPVVAFDNPWGHWILRDGENSLLAKRTVDSLADQLERLCSDAVLRKRLSAQALTDIGERHGDWDTALSGIYDYLCDPEGTRSRE
jgi:GT2 family glycosyltransferase/glycosyltransferase involved in cell wall biosynthesis